VSGSLGANYVNTELRALLYGTNSSVTLLGIAKFECSMARFPKLRNGEWELNCMWRKVENCSSFHFCFDRYHTCGNTTGQPYQSDTPSDSSHCCVTGQSGGTYPCHSPAAWRQGIVQYEAQRATTIFIDYPVVCTSKNQNKWGT